MGAAIKQSASSGARGARAGMEFAEFIPCANGHTQVQLESSPARKQTFQVWGGCFLFLHTLFHLRAFRSSGHRAGSEHRLNCLNAPGFYPRLVLGTVMHNCVNDFEF